DVWLTTGLLSKVVLPPGDNELLAELAKSGAAVTVKEPKHHVSILALLLPLLMIGLLVVMLVGARRRARAGGAAGLPDMSLRKSPEVIEVPAERFADVAGVDEAVEELGEVVHFFREPGRFAHLGAKMPSGIMLHGDPGTGKTLLAKALAGEA